MPIHEYECKCGEIKEVLIRTPQKDTIVCDKCKKKMERIVSAANFDLKGAGFYCNDYYRRRKNGNES